MTLLALGSMGTQLCIPVLVLSGTAQVLVLQVLDCRYWYCWYVILLVVSTSCEDASCCCHVDVQSRELSHYFVQCSEMLGLGFFVGAR
eukprot:SAG31_NODE_4635_length_3081_cov_2.484574_5_plen_88_part_00